MHFTVDKFLLFVLLLIFVKSPPDRFKVELYKELSLMLSAKLQCCEDGKGNTYTLVQTFMVRMKAFGGTLFFLLHKRSAGPLSVPEVFLDLYIGCSFNLHLLFSLANDHYSDPLALVRGIDANDGDCYSSIALSTSKKGKK